jgi:predicted RecB family nuclease
VKLSTFSKEIKKTILLLNKTLENKTPPIFRKNPHCQICEFFESCLNKLKERDDLSLLGNFKAKEIEQQNNRGIFSVKQLS